MPGIDFDRLRHEITMEQVLDLLGFECTRPRGDQWYGYCPLHESKTKHRRAFSVNVREGCYYCHKCRSRGDHLKLWAEAIKTPLHPATIDLCHQLGLEVPWLHRPRPTGAETEEATSNPPSESKTTVYPR